MAIKALKDKVDSLLPQEAPNRLEADNYLKALYGLTKMLDDPSVEQYLKGLNKQPTTTLGHLISFMHTFNLRFGAAKTPVQEPTYDQLYPLLVALRDQAKAPSANPYTTSSGPQDPKAVSTVLLADAVRPEARCRAASPAAARAALMSRSSCDAARLVEQCPASDAPTPRPSPPGSEC